MEYCQCSEKTVYKTKNINCYEKNHCCSCKYYCSKKEYPVIFVVLDQMINLESIPENIQKEFTGFKKWKKRTINFLNHQITSTPCSPSRSSLYTGKHVNITKVTDNTNNSWQVSMPDVSTGLKTMGTYFKNKGDHVRYIGKVHFNNELDRTRISRYKPTMATQDYMKRYDFETFNKKGDFAYDIHGAFFSDKDVLNEVLPPGNDPNKCDLYDYKNNEAYDGGIPYLKKKHLDNDNKFFICMNFENPHDITYANIETDQELSTTTFQLSGNKIDTPDNLRFGINAQYNKNYRKFYDTPLIFNESYELDNNYNSKTNKDPLYLSIVTILLGWFYMYGTNPNNKIQYQAYQTNYLQQIKQIDNELEILYDFLEEYDYFNKAVIVLTSDHGEFNASHGLFQKNAVIYKEAWNTILFISYPKMSKKYREYKYNFVTSHVQILPTLLLLSNKYNLQEIFNLGLYEPIFDENKMLKYQDFKNLKLGLPTGYGSIILPILTSISQTNSELKNELKEKIPLKMNYFSLPGYSVSANIKLNNKYYNIGYYFNLIHLLIDTIQNILNLPNKKEIILNKLNTLKENNQEFNNDSIVILRNSINEKGFGLVGSYKDIKVQLYSSDFAKLYFSNPLIEFFDESNSEYKFIADNPIYPTKIYSNSILFNKDNVLTFIPPQPILPIDPYTIIDQDASGSVFIFVGEKDYINFTFKTDPVVKNYFINPIIIQGKPSEYSTYVCNDPIYQNNQIYTKNSVDIPITISKISNLLDTIISIFSFEPKEVYKFLFEHTQYFFFNSLNFYITQVLTSFIDTGFLILPGRKKTVEELLLLNYQVQVFNDTDDSNELFNLADSSRIYNNNNIETINKLLKRLDEHITYNNCDNIFISLPIDIVIQETFVKIKEFTKNNVPKIYNYRILTDNYYNKVE
jgi:arylsulfatase A-like enzyme